MTEVEYTRQNASLIGSYKWGGEVDCEVWHDNGGGRLVYINGEDLVGETSDSYQNQKLIEMFPDIYVVRIFDTEYFDQEWLRELKIARAWSVYIFNKRKRVHLCSVTPCYELFLVDTEFEYIEGFEPDDSTRDANDYEFREACAHDERVVYFNKLDIDRLPEDQVFHHGIEKTEGDSLTEEEVLEGLCEHYSANSIW